MRQGRFWRLPEGPADFEQLWLDAAPLDPATRPEWLDAEDCGHYRLVGSRCCRGLSGEQQHAFFAELEELEEAGLVIEEDARQPSMHHVLVEPLRFDQRWSISIYCGASPLALQPFPQAAHPVLTRDHITDVPAAFVADPFMIRHGHSWHMLFEVLNWNARKGEIAWAESSDGFTWSYRGVVLAEDFHLSYPYVFTWKGEYYLVPESHQASEIRLYRAKRFPTDWTFVRPLLEGPNLTDASLLRRGGIWWMLLESSPNGADDTLRIYSALELEGPWREHPRSPIVCGDSANARPAGRIVEYNGRLLRFAQNCSFDYGTHVGAHEILELTESEYRERPAAPGPILGPSGQGWNARGMHHIDAHPWESGLWVACVDGWEDAYPADGA